MGSLMVEGNGADLAYRGNGNEIPASKHHNGRPDSLLKLRRPFWKTFPCVCVCIVLAVMLGRASLGLLHSRCGGRH